MTLKVSAVQRIRDTPRQRGLVSSCGNFRRGGEWMRRGVNRLRWSPTQPAGLLPGDAPTQQQERMLGRLAALPACHLQVAKIALSLSHCSASLPPFPSHSVHIKGCHIQADSLGVISCYPCLPLSFSLSPLLPALSLRIFILFCYRFIDDILYGKRICLDARYLYIKTPLSVCVCVCVYYVFSGARLMSILYALLDNDNDDDGGHLGGSLGGPAAFGAVEPLKLRGMQKLTNGRELDAWPARQNRQAERGGRVRGLLH